MSLKRKRVKVYVDVLGVLLTMDNPTRSNAIDVLRRYFEKEGIEPFRGTSKPPDIYEKELISLYIVGTRGLGIDRDYPDKFKAIFSAEMVYDELVRAAESSDVNNIKDVWKGILGRDVTEVDVARVLRFIIVLYYLDFVQHDYVAKMLRKIAEAFPEYIETVRRFTKFFVAIKISSDIANGVIRDKMKKELTKQLLLLDVGVSKSVPSDKYIREIAKVLFNIPKKTLDKTLK